MWGGDVTRGSHAVEGGFLSEALGLSVNLQVMGQKSETRKRLSSKRKDLSLWSLHNALLLSQSFTPNLPLKI